jgi:hypothetical protein
MISRTARYCCVIFIAGMFAAAAPMSAKIVKTKKLNVNALTVGSGFEYQTDSEEDESGMPFLVEWGFTDALKLTVEPNYVMIHLKPGGRIKGWGDIETSLTFDALEETRFRPGFGMEGLIKWPTASNRGLSTGRADFTLGGIASKELGPVDMDANLDYTFVGSPSGVKALNRLEFSIAAEWHLNPFLDLEGELVTNFGSAGGFTGKPGTIRRSAVAAEENGSEFEGTLGVAELFGRSLKLEEGLVLVSDGSWQAIVAWEWDFGGDR